MSIPATQKSWRVVRRGSPSKALEFAQDAPVPLDLQHGQVLVKVEAAALNPVSYMLMKLLPNAAAGRPYAAAEYDLAGIVVASKSLLHQTGDRVFGMISLPLQKSSKQGALAQYTRRPGENLARVPDNASIVGAAGIALAGLTAYQALVDIANIQEGQTVFVNGGSTSVGIFAIQIAKARGCKVWASASGGNEELVRKLGADEFIDYTKAPLHRTLGSSPPTPKFHVFLEAVGIADPALYTHSPAYLAPNGIFLSVGPQPDFSSSGAATVFRIIWQLFLRPTWLGGTKRKYQIMQMEHSKPNLDALAKLFGEGKLTPVVDSVFAFEDTLKAYDRLMTKRAKGKVVVKVDPTLK